MTSIFTYVARDIETGKAALINKLDTSSNEIESKIFNERENLAKKKKIAMKTIQLNSVISNNNIQLLMEKGSSIIDMPALCRNEILMKYTSLENCVLCQPQNVNTRL